MAKVGYIYNTPHADGLADDREWMRLYGCVQVAEEAAETKQERESTIVSMYNRCSE